MASQREAWRKITGHHKRKRNQILLYDVIQQVCKRGSREAAFLKTVRQKKDNARPNSAKRKKGKEGPDEAGGAILRNKPETILRKTNSASSPCRKKKVETGERFKEHNTFPETGGRKLSNAGLVVEGGFRGWARETSAHIEETGKRANEIMGIWVIFFSTTLP